MTGEKVSAMLNRQINAELYSAYLYWDFARHFDRKGLKGFGTWYKIQAREEIEHARKIYNYMQDQGCAIKLKTIDGPKEKLGDILSVARLGLAHEQEVTAMIDEIYGVAFKEKDLRTMNFLAWFIAEQAEEEKNASEIIDMISLSQKGELALYLVDIRMGNRKKENNYGN